MTYRYRVATLALVDVALVSLALYLALWLRFDGRIQAGEMVSFYRFFLIFAGVRVVCFHLFGLYNRLWAYASIGELLAIIYAVSIGSTINITLTYLFQDPFPRSVVLLSWGLNIMLIGASRMLWRVWRDKHLVPISRRGGRPTLIVGAGDTGALVLRELQRQNGQHYNPIGFIDDADEKQKLQLLGLPVLGTSADLADVIERFGVKEVILAIPSAPGQQVKEMLAICRSREVNLKVLPALSDLIDGSVSVSSLREVQVEDLLGRETVAVDLEEIAGYLRGRVVLVTGAGGSIGSELCRQVARYQPEKILLLGHGENSIYEIDLELAMTSPELCRVTVIADVRDQHKIDRIFSLYRPQVVFHAAANKHVPLMEDYPEEALKTNVYGTRNVANAARRYGAERFVLVSTDKAVNPTSVMGASKRLAEMVVLSMAEEDKPGTRFMAVRFGNVLDSRGSVVPLFRRQIAAGGPVTVTHPEMKRYFMIIPEAVQLMIQAGAMGEGGEVFVLDMGEPVRIVDLAENMIRLSGLEPIRDIEIKFTGMRPGEKLFEEIMTAEEGTTTTRHKRIFISNKNVWDRIKLQRGLERLEKVVFRGSSGSVRVLLHNLLPNYQGSPDREEVSIKAFTGKE